jgi:hypothetical protein
MEELFTFDAPLHMSLMPSGLWHMSLDNEVVVAVNPVDGFISLLTAFQAKGSFPTKGAPNA